MRSLRPWVAVVYEILRVPHQSLSTTIVTSKMQKLLCFFFTLTVKIDAYVDHYLS